MSPSDLDINRMIRRVLVKHWIDLGKLAFRTVRGRAVIRGALERIPGMETVLSLPIVEAIFREIDAIPGLRHLQVELTNWKYSQGRWIPLGQFAPGGPPGPAGAAKPREGTGAAPITLEEEEDGRKT